MKIALLGASGKTGAQVMRLAVAGGHTVTALVRDPAALAGVSGVTVAKGDCTQAADVDAAVAGADVIVSCVGSRTLKANITRSLTATAAVAAAKKHGVRRIVWLSACGVGDSAPQAKQASFFFGYVIMPLLLKANYADADVAEQILRSGGVPAAIVRPVGLNDEGAKNNAIAIDKAGKPARAYISRADVAAWMLARAVDGTADGASTTLF